MGAAHQGKPATIYIQGRRTPSHRWGEGDAVTARPSVGNHCHTSVRRIDGTTPPFFPSPLFRRRVFHRIPPTSTTCIAWAKRVCGQNDWDSGHRSTGLRLTIPANPHGYRRSASFLLPSVAAVGLASQAEDRGSSPIARFQDVCGSLALAHLSAPLREAALQPRRRAIQISSLGQRRAHTLETNGKRVEAPS